MCNRELAAVVHGARMGNKMFVLCQPRSYHSLLLFELAAHQRHVAAVGNKLLPTLDKRTLCLYILCIDHEPRSVSVETMHKMRSAARATLFKIAVEHSLHSLLAGIVAHREQARALVDDQQIGILVDNAKVVAAKRHLLLRAVENHRLSGNETGKRVSGDYIIHKHKAIHQQRLCTVTADAVHGLHQKRQKLRLFFDFESQCIVFLFSSHSLKKLFGNSVATHQKHYILYVVSVGEHVHRLHGNHLIIIIE